MLIPGDGIEEAALELMVERAARLNANT